MADTDVAVALTWAAFAMSLMGLVLAVIHKLSFKEIEETILSGISTMLLAWLIGMFIAFSTGTSWGTMAILTPIAVPLAYNIGDHCSPISDTTVMSSIFAGSDHIAHVKTQIPYALVPAVISAILYLLSSFIPNVWILLVIGIVALFFTLRFLGDRYQKKNFSKEDIELINSVGKITPLEDY